MSETSVALPSDGPVAELLVAGPDGEPRLRGGRCAACGRHSFPVGAGCPWCGGPPPEAVLLSERGTLWGWTAVTAAPPGYAGPVPYGFGVVELPEGLRVVTRLTEADPGRMEAGQAMRLITEALPAAEGDEPLVVWAFAPEGAA